jgi:hypothetical protein
VTRGLHHLDDVAAVMMTALPYKPTLRVSVKKVMCLRAKNIVVIGINQQGCTLSIELRTGYAP